MQTYFDDQLEASEDYEPLLVELHRQVHALAGTSGTFGYEKVSLCLRELEAHLDELIESVPISFDAKCVNKIKSYFSSIDAAISDISL